jgi:hypothetical protein
LHDLGHQLISHRAAFYADDMIMFLKLEASDIHVAREIFKLFKGSSGLGCSLNKSQLVPIRCSLDQVELAINLFPCQLVQFPIKYLGARSQLLSYQRLPSNPWLIKWLIDSLHGKEI